MADAIKLVETVSFSSINFLHTGVLHLLPRGSFDGRRNRCHKNPFILVKICWHASLNLCVHKSLLKQHFMYTYTVSNYFNQFVHFCNEKKSNHPKCMYYLGKIILSVW